MAEAKQALIERIDLLAHPFYPYHKESKYEDVFKEDLQKIWRACIDEAAADLKKMMIIAPSVWPKVGYKDQQELYAYAKKRLGNRLAFLECYPPLERPKKFFFYFAKNGWKKGTGKKTHDLKEMMSSLGFRFNSERIRTRGMGEYTNICVISFLTLLNIELGMENPIPYRNPQSMVLPKKSIAKNYEYFMPWELAELRATARQREEEVNKRMQEFINERRAAANLASIRFGHSAKGEFEQRLKRLR
jgi:hypothetical protein